MEGQYEHNPLELLARVADHLRALQSGPTASRETARALTKVEEAMLWLQSPLLARTYPKKP